MPVLRLRPLFRLGALAGILLLSSAHAADDEGTASAKRLFKEASRDYQKGRYSEAISEFEAAYRAKPHPFIFFNLARCYEKLNNAPRALAYFRRYVREAPDAKDRGEVEATIARLEHALNERGVQALIINTDPPGATVALDGQPRGHTPFAGELSLGAHRLELTLAGFETVSRDLLAQPGGSNEIQETLTRSPPPPPPTEDVKPPVPEKPEPPVVVAKPETAPVVTTPPPAPPPAPRERHRTWTWIAAGVGGACLIGGLLAGASASANARQLTGATTPLDQQRAQGLYDSAVGAEKTSNTLYVLGGIGVLAGTTLFFLEGSF